MEGGRREVAVDEYQRGCIHEYPLIIRLTKEIEGRREERETGREGEGEGEGGREKRVPVSAPFHSD